MTKRHSKSIHYHAVFQWFSKIFLAVSLLFCIALIPLFFSMKNAFEEVQIEKRKQMLNNGVSQISSTVTGIINASKALSHDTRFLSFRYKDVDYNTIALSTQNQFQSTLKNLMQPFDLVSHTALFLDEKATVTNYTVFFNNQLDYYPNFFQVNDLSYEEWITLLSETTNHFTDVCHIKTYDDEFDAIIYVTPWASSKYFYSCIRIEDIKESVLEKKNQSDCYITIQNSDNEILYSDLPVDISKYQSFKEVSDAGEITLLIHIPDSVFYENMRPFYLFFTLYSIVCFMLIVSANVVGVKKATKPIMNIISILEQSSNIPAPENASASVNTPQGFDYISNSIIRADQNMSEYQTAIQTQQKVLRARFLEKAISGQLVTKNDIRDFHAYFPNFPQKYYMFLIKLWTYTTEPTESLYSEPVLLLQTFLEAQLPYLYQQQINDTELLLILSEDDYVHSCNTLNFMINNINQEEPNYHACCIASNAYDTLEDLPTAYQRLQTMNELPHNDYQTHICRAEDFYVTDLRNPVTMSDLMTLYTAITAGNLELSLNRLSAYSNILAFSENFTFTRPVFDIIRNMLKYIKIDYPQLLIDLHIPNFTAEKNLYNQLADTVCAFCTQISEYNDANKDSFTQELFNYIDTHYTDCDICLTSLKTYFKCSESTIRKVFKRVTDVPIARYIEQKRMILANELLAKSNKSVTEIAQECGYALPHSFYKAYKRVYGHAPTLPNGSANIDFDGDEDDDEV